MVKEKEGVIEESVELLERIPKGYLNGTTTKQAYTILGITAITAATLGGWVTYKLTQKKLREHYEKITAEEIQEARDYYRTMKKDGPLSTPEGAAAVLVPDADILKTKVSDLHYDQPEKLPDPEEVVEEESEVRNIFTEAEPTPGWDHEAELEKRTEEAPYIITTAEYMEGEKGYEQSTLTYFEGDDVLSDDHDGMIEEIEATVGYDNLSRFGEGSNDKNTVYIRNDRQELDMEIIKSEGDFAKEVLGFDESQLKHSDERRPRRMRREDE